MILENIVVWILIKFILHDILVVLGSKNGIIIYQMHNMFMPSLFMNDNNDNDTKFNGKDTDRDNSDESGIRSHNKSNAIPNEKIWLH